MMFPPHFSTTSLKVDEKEGKCDSIVPGLVLSGAKLQGDFMIAKELGQGLNFTAGKIAFVAVLDCSPLVLI